MKNLLIILATSLAVSLGTALPTQAKNTAKPPTSLANVPNKTALAKWTKPKPHDATANKNGAKKVKGSLVSKFAKAEASAKTQTFKCGLIYSDSWEEDEEQYGAYSFSIDNVSSFKQLYLNTAAPANGGGFFTEDKYIFTSYTVDDWGYDYDVITYVVNTNTWKVEGSYSQGTLYAMASDLAYDPIEKKAFGTFYSGDDSGNTYWGYMDPDNECDITYISTMEGSLVAVAANNQGEIYGITSGGYLVKVDKYSGTLTAIGNTNISPYYMQSAAFDDNGTLYWAASFSDGSTGLFTVNLENGHVTLVDAFDDEEEVVALYADPTPADDGAPAEATDLALSFVDDALTGKITFSVPGVDNTGAALSGNVTYIINIDGEDSVTGTAEAGSTVEAAVSVASAGVHTFSVRLSNDKGESKRTSISQWVGIDRPVAVTDLTLVKTGDLQATITWTAPTKGALDGFFDPARLSYTVTRMPENKVVATGLTETSFVDNIESDTKVYITYSVTAYADNVAGASATSNGAIFGHALTVPVEFNFATEADYNIFTIIDNNETANLDSGMWQYSPSGQCAGYVCGTKDGDDWMITPDITLKADRQYTLCYDVLCYSDYWPDEYELYMGTDVTIEAMNTRLVEPTTIYWDEYRTNTLTITVPEDGNYTFGFHALSEAGGAFFLVDNIKLTESYMLKAPAKVENLTAVAGALGELTAKVSLTTPTKAVDGTNLDALTAVKLYRGNQLVKTFDNPALGAELTFDDSNLSQGFIYYTAVACNAIGEGVESEVEVWVGYDIPAEPINVSATVVNSHPVITWEAPGTVGQNGGYVDPSQLTYIVYRSNDDKIIAEEYTQFSFTDESTTIATEGAQKAWNYAVYAEAAAGIGNCNEAFVVSGASYPLPFTESFKNGTSSQLWLVDGNEGDYWSIVNDWVADPQDNDKGLILITPYTPGSSSTIVSGKIDMSKSKNAQLSFYLQAMTYEDNGFAETDAADDYLEVLVASTDYKLTPIKTIRPNDIKKGEYLNYTIPLDEYNGKDFILIGFALHAVAAQSPLAIDNISITNNYDANLAVKSVTVPDEVNVTEDFEAVVTVKNDAVNSANDFKVEIKLNDDVLASTTEGVALAAGESREYTLTLTALPAWGESETLTAVAILSGDENDADNEANATVKIARPDMPAVDDLCVSVNSDNEAVFTWSEPQVNAFATVYEGFESYDHGKASNIGDWTLVDEDGVFGVDDIYTDDEYLDIPHPLARLSFQVINPDSMFDDGVPAQWTTHSGTKMIVSFRNWEYDNDDWLISPRLSGQAQTISFWARSPRANTDKMIVYYSSTDTDTDSFTRTEEGRITLTTEWTQYTFDLAEGTYYFAVRNNQTGGEAIMLDDFEFQTGASWAIVPEVEGYNLYKNGEIVNDGAIASTTYTVPANNDGTYFVTVLYNVGESEASNSVLVINTGVENVAVDGDNNQPTYDVYGRRVYNLQPGQIYVRKGEKFIHKQF